LNRRPAGKEQEGCKIKTMHRVILLVAVIFSLSAKVGAEPARSVTFCSINKPDARLYKISHVVLARAFKNLGIDFQIKEMAPNRIPVMLNAGLIDGDTHRIFEFNRENVFPNMIRVEEPIQQVDQNVFTRLDTIKVNGWESLLPFKIIYLSGIKLVENGLNRINMPGDNRIGVYDIDDAFHLLNIGRGDLVIVSPSTGRATLKKLDLTHSGIKMIQPPVVTIKLYPYMHRRHRDLAAALAMELKKMKASGQYARLVNPITD